MIYECEKLPDFYSVRDIDQINYSLQDMENKKCYLFLDNGFSSNVIEPNKRDIKFGMALCYLQILKLHQTI